MIDLSHLADAVRVTPFFTIGTSSWYKDRRARWVMFWFHGAGGGGGGGRSGAAASARGGGGGGGGASQFRMIVPALLLPDRLTIRIPAGGLGGAANTAGSAGGTLAVWIGETSESQEAYFNIVSAGGGGAGLTTAGGTVGGSGSNGLGASLFQLYLGNVQWIAGSAGGAHTGAAGANVAPQLNYGMTGGAGGGGCTTTDFKGGDQTGRTGYYPTLAGGAAGGGNGANGWYNVMDNMPLSLPGAGGGSNNAGTGGSGGNGGPGCGGGGGGAGVTGGAGGKGGQGFGWIVEF